jgi:hypothetical protein
MGILVTMDTSALDGSMVSIVVPVTVVVTHAGVNADTGTPGTYGHILRHDRCRKGGSAQGNDR